ncbi:cullin-3a-like protein [Trifolium pratense]|uniref:Cullin-3a-like protein n=2 Tax=Trifolium pratense TaxID=57577 RepID=A0A2K3NA68_TRIPR|nr:cullin-3a-like protein [Trifolium pratense]
MQNFYASHSGLVDGPTLTVKVLTTRFWPTQSTVTCKLPAEISELCEKFRSYYLGTHAGRKLSWQTKMGTADLKATFRKGQRHELIVSTYQMCVLILFNNADRLSYKEIEQATEIPASDLKRCLQSLALVKGKNVLKKEPMSKDFSEDDVFFVNDKFSSKLYKVKIGTFVAAKESEPEKVETQQRIEEHWKPQIDAAIVRIMKSRKQLDHNHLIAEVTKQLQSRFLANPIERLLDEKDKYDKIISLAYYMLQKGLKGVSEDDAEITLVKVVMMMMMMQRSFFSGKTVSDDAENCLIVMLNAECGYQLTSKSEVFKTGFWPMQSSVACNLPAEISTLCGHIISALILAGDCLGKPKKMGTAYLKATFGKGRRHELNVSTYQMCVLMLFNSDSLSYQKEPMSKDVSEDDEFFVNGKFSSKMYKQLDHNNLIAEVTKELQPRFLANPTELKKQIESLFERDFLDRVHSDRKLYRYLA